MGVLATALLPPPPRRTDTGLQGLLRISMAHFHSIFKKSALGPRQKENGKLLQELTFKSQPRTEKAVHEGAVFTVGLGPTFLFFRFFLISMCCRKLGNLRAPAGAACYASVHRRPRVLFLSSHLPGFPVQEAADSTQHGCHARPQGEEAAGPGAGPPNSNTALASHTAPLQQLRDRKREPRAPRAVWPAEPSRGPVPTPARDSARPARGHRPHHDAPGSQPTGRSPRADAVL